MPNIIIVTKVSNFLFIFISALFLLISGTGNIKAQQFVEGTDYVALDGDAKIQRDGTVQVIEFFWYGCPACFRFEPYLESWKKNKPETIDFVAVPASLRDSWEIHARAHFAIDLAGSDGRLESAFYKEIHENDNRMRNEQAFSEWAQSQPGVDAEKFVNSLNSFGIVTKLNQARLLIKIFRINSVPTLVVGGKYRTSPSMAGSEQRSLEIVEYLANKILEES